MANPRKFSEKIALHTHRQAEETARFEQIMREVSDATARVAPDRASTKNTLRINSQTLGSFRGGSLPNVSAGAPTVKTTTSRNADSAKPEDVNIMSHSHRESRARSQGGPIRRPQDRKHDTSPYSPGPFLSPPPDTSWRRANSDSALHQSAMQGMNNERNDNSNGRWMMQSMNGPEHHDGRPKSSCDVPRVPGINIYPSAHEPGTIQIPIGNNTGSLPDLTSVHFPSPMPTPLDHDGENQGSSPYGSSPVNTSPSTLSPTSLQHGLRQAGRFQFASPGSPSHSQSQSQSQQQNHLSVPVNSRYLHHTKTIDKHMVLPDAIDYAQLAGMSNMYQQQIPPSFQSPTFQQMACHRSPRPSPQSSPGLGGRHSAPCSPGAPSPLPNDTSTWFNPAAELQHHLENFSMDWAQLVASLMESGCTWSAQVQLDNPPVNDMSYMDQAHVTQTHQQTLPEVSSAANELLGDGGYYSTSPSQLVYPTAPPSTHTTPNTPTGIPDIIFTDCSMGESALAKQLETDFLDNDLLREGLEPLDSEQIELLQDTGFNFISSNVEDSFRLGHS